MTEIFVPLHPYYRYGEIAKLMSCLSNALAITPNDAENSISAGSWFTREDIRSNDRFQDSCFADPALRGTLLLG